MKVLLLSKYSRMGASSRLRSLQFIPSLNAAGISVKVSSLFDERYLNTLYKKGRKPKFYSMILYIKRLIGLLRIFRYDVVWIEKEIFPYFPAIAERVLGLLGKPYVVDYDDAVFHNYDLSDRWLIRFFLGEKIDVVMSNAACVITGNDYLAHYAKQAGASHVEVIPTVVDSERYCSNSSEKNGQLVIGWIGSPSTQRYVVEIGAVLEKVCTRFGACVLMVGANENVKEQLSGVPVEVLPWSEQSETGAVSQMDIGIMPLEDGPWEKGKCGYKLIQYMASGLPVVASPVGVNVKIVTECGSGRLAEDDAGWEGALALLLEDTELRRALGQSGRKKVEDVYSLQAQSPKLAHLLKMARSSSGSSV